MTFFMKKRPDLPKQPDLSNQEGFGLFVQRDPVSGEETEILASSEMVSSAETAPRRPSHDITDVVSVEVVESAEPRAVPGLRTRKPKDEPQDVVPTEAVVSAPEDSSLHNVPGLRAARKPKPEQREPDATEAPVTPRTESNAQGIPGLRAPRKNKDESAPSPVPPSDSSNASSIPGLRMPRKNKEEVATTQAPSLETSGSSSIPGLRTPRKSKDEPTAAEPQPATSESTNATGVPGLRAARKDKEPAPATDLPASNLTDAPSPAPAVPGLRTRPSTEAQSATRIEAVEEQFASRFVKQTAEPIVEPIVPESVVPAPEPTPVPTLGLRITRKAEAEPQTLQPVETGVQEDLQQVTVPAPKSGLADLAKRFKKAAPAPEAEKPAGGSLLGRFGKKTAAIPEDVAQEPVVAEAKPSSDAPKKSLSSLWSRAKSAPNVEAKSEAKTDSKSDVKATKKPVKKTKAAKAPRAAAGGQLDLLIELDAERRVYWRVTPNGLSPVEGTEVLQAASFSAEDGRYPAESVLSYNQAMTVVLTEIGEDCRIVNESKAHGAVYGTKATRVKSLLIPIGPGQMLVQELLRTGDHSGHDLVVGLLLNDEASTQSLAILYHINSQGYFSTPQITVNPDNLSFTLSQFAASKRLDVDATEVLLFKNAELLSVAGALQFYPNETVWNGVPVRKLIWGATVLSCAAAVAAAGFGGYAFLTKRSLEQQQSALTNQIQQIDTELKTLVSDSLVSFAATQAVDVQEVTTRAAHLWVPYSKVTLEATATSQRFDIHMPLVGGGLFNNRPSVLGQRATGDVQPLIGMSAPEGCSKDILGVSGGLDAVQISITCESTPRAVHRYRTD